MIIRVLRYFPTLALILASCATSGSNGLVDPDKDAGLTVELDIQAPKWNSPPKLEIGVKKGDLLGYYSRDENAEGDVDGLSVYDTGEQLLYTATAYIHDEGREVLVTRPGEDDSSVRAPYSPSLPSSGIVDFPGEPYQLGYGYARKGGADGYRHEQWIFSRAGIPVVIYETRDYKGKDPLIDVFTSPAYLEDGGELLLWAGLSVIFRELDSADRNREAQEKAADYLMDQSKDDAREKSGFSFGFN